MEQPTPTYEDQDLERVVFRDYGSAKLPEVKSVLELYGTEEWQREPLRVQMACLKLANGNIEELNKYVEVACQDYRDVLAWAEYSAYMKAKTAEQQRKAIESDWKELQTWLHRT